MSAIAMLPRVVVFPVFLLPLHIRRDALASRDCVLAYVRHVAQEVLGSVHCMVVTVNRFVNAFAACGLLPEVACDFVCPPIQLGVDKEAWGTGDTIDWV